MPSEKQPSSPSGTPSSGNPGPDSLSPEEKRRALEEAARQLRLNRQQPPPPPPRTPDEEVLSRLD